VTTIALFFQRGGVCDGLVGGDAFYFVKRFPTMEYLAHWIRSGSFSVDFAFYLDQLSLVMLLVVTGSWISDSRLLRRLHGGGPQLLPFFSYLNLFHVFYADAGASG